jgi:NAD(P)-dependent dehydrogenase (short-subunit alcohol dehydrogenase family)
MDKLDFTGKVVVVTGGTRGIGFSTVTAFLEHGATVVLFGSRQETVDKALHALQESHPGAPAEGKCPDLSDAQAVRDAFAEIEAKYGHIDVLVNNAGISQSQSLYNYKPEDFEKILDVNVKAVFNGCYAVAPIMKKQGGGVILNTSSMVSLYGQRSGCGYPMSKFAVNGMTKSLARELGPDGIRVNAVAPGVTDTDMVAALPEQYRKPLMAAIPLGRFGRPEDIANAFLFLASDLGSYITGAVLSVDGGIVM